jgi:hypothetical protein
VRPASPDGPPWVVLGAKAVEALGALHGEGWPPWPNRLGGNRMKKLTGLQLFGGPTRARKTKARIARAQLLMAAARERAAEMAQGEDLPLRFTHAHRRRLAQLRSL